jgi:phage internal scaffolding protein
MAKKLKTLDYPEPGQKTVEYTDHRGRKRRKVTLDCGQGLTEQSQAKATDINYILREYTKTGFIRHAKDHAGIYDDFTVTDFQEAQYVIAESKSMFESLPSEIRKKHNNDPVQFLNWVQDPKNKEELKSMGVIIGNDGKKHDGTPSGAPTESTNVPETPSPAPAP